MPEDSIQPRGDPLLQMLKVQAGAVRSGEHSVNQRRLISPLKGRLKVGLLTKSQDALIVGRNTAEERGVEQQWMVTIIGDVFGLQRDLRIMIPEKNSLSRLEYGNVLAVSRGGIEHEHRSGGAR